MQESLLDADYVTFGQPPDLSTGSGNNKRTESRGEINKDINPRIPHTVNRLLEEIRIATTLAGLEVADVNMHAHFRSSGFSRLNARSRDLGRSYRKSWMFA